MTSPFTKLPPLTPYSADFRARCLVNGYEKHSKSGELEPIAGGWSTRFRSHPWVIQSEKEGWGRDLRMSCVAAARDRIMAGVKPNDIEPEDVMPKADYVEHWRNEARKAQEATEWRRKNPNHPAIRGNMEIDPEAFLRRLGINRPEPDFDPETGVVRDPTGERD